MVGHLFHAIAKGPYLDISDSFESGKSIFQLIEDGEMSPLFQDLEPDVGESILQKDAHAIRLVTIA